MENGIHQDIVTERIPPDFFEPHARSSVVLDFPNLALPRYHNAGRERSTTPCSPDYMRFIHGGPTIHTCGECALSTKPANRRRVYTDRGRMEVATCQCPAHGHDLSNLHPGGGEPHCVSLHQKGGVHPHLHDRRVQLTGLQGVRTRCRSSG